jgi:hypothetical protein
MLNLFISSLTTKFYASFILFIFKFFENKGQKLNVGSLVAKTERT